MQTNLIAIDYNNGASSLSLAEKYNVSKQTILRHLKKAGVPRRSLSAACIKNTLDSSFFQSIDTELKAYWLGFLLADGNIGTGGRYKKGQVLRVALQDRDRSHLEKLKDAIRSSHTLKDNLKTRSSWLCITSIGLTRPLVKNGWHEFKKNGDVRIMDLVPNELRRHLLRGLIDGDGTLGCYNGKWRLGFTDRHRPVTEWVKREIEKAGIVSSASVYQQKIHQNWTFYYSGNRIAKKAVRLLYRNCTVSLDRKLALATEALRETDLQI